jgi:poly-gamma-glutamate capsule biosynthesis protein CapA/YwtB (metallophosphatase superfamily)
LVRHVKELREQGVVFIIANYHWGDMYSYIPNNQQKNMAHFAIDNGADLVIGHHPHVLQGMETYKGKNIVYSLGNFCYGGKMNPSDKDTIIFQQIISFDISKKEIAGTDYKIIPASISSRTDRNDFQPTIAAGEEAERIIKKFESISIGSK